MQLDDADQRLDSVRGRRPTMLRRRLTVPAIAIALLLSVALIAIGVWAGQSIVSVMSNRLVQEMTRAVDREVGHFVEEPARALPRVVNDLVRHDVPLTDAPAVARELYGLLSVEPELDWIYFDNDAGGLISVGRFPDGTTVFLMTDGFRAGTLREYAALPGGDVGQLRRSLAMFDARLKPWYVQARQTGKQFWTEPYSGADLPVLGISAAAPVLAANGAFEGVSGTGLIFTRVTDFMRTLQLGVQGRTFIVDGTGQLIAASGGVLPVRIGADGQQSRIEAAAARDPVVQGMGQYLRAHPELLRRASADLMPLSIDLPGLGTTYAAVEPFEAEGGIRWTIVSALPAADYLRPVWRAIYMSLAISAGVVVIALALGYWAFGSVLRPLTALTGAVHAIARGEWGDVPEAERNDEIGVLARAFSTMTQRLKATLDGLRESEQRFREYAEAASDWFWETDADHRFTYVSRTRISNMDTAADSIGGQRWDFAADVDSEPEKWRQHRAALAAHLPFRGFRYQARWENGSTAYVEASGKPVFDAEHRFMGYRGVASDVTAAVRAELAERALRQAEANLAHVNRAAALGEMTASIAHEMNQPLTAVITNAGASLRWLAATPPDFAEARAGLERIIRDGNRASEVIRRMTALFRKSTALRDSFDINAAILEVVALARPEVQRNRITLLTQLAAGLPAVSADRIQVQQVILNIVVNAIQALSGTEEGPRELLIQSALEGTDSVVVAVRDTGPGFEPGSSDALFTPFYTTKPDGMGMGLAICRSIIEAHGGRLWATANTPRGACFRFTLPRAAENAAPASTPA
jgi:PAS domain S-box-containing protein